jgi:restriction system protein
MPGPQFVKYFVPVLAALKELGNSGRPSEVRERIAQALELRDEELEAPLNSGGSRFQNQVAWAKFYLAKAGYIDASARGVWSLTEKGVSANMTASEALRVFREVHKQFQDKNADEEEEAEEETSPISDHRARLLQIIRDLPPAGFERLCMRLLREAGFQQVDVTGRTGDGGIDGKGILQINPLLSMQVVFQSKRYGARNLVTVSQIRDLRGAMAGRTDKGIFITTSDFTAEARREALREGVSPIELVDAEKLVDMFEEFQLGVFPTTEYQVDPSFFEEFKEDK